ncbi:MAG TPA: hypothetical protein VKS82_16790 [Streptosporangiaceae bacterium]|nr:hypothetical protein [Streptosporangiaceae bacterium]
MTTDRAALTAGYLDEVARHGATGADLLSVIPSTGLLDTDPHLSRPLFLGRAEAEQLNSDLQHVRAALASLPAKLYDGDLTAFARDSGLTDSQISAVLRSRAGRPVTEVTQLARGDLYPQPSGLRLLEFNMGSAIAGIDNADLCRAMLRYPLLREFARTHRLGYVDTMSAEIDLIFGETGFARDSYPMVAMVAWSNLYKVYGSTLHKMARRWRAKGLDAHACHIGQLKVRNGKVMLRGRQVDIIFRIFIIEQMLLPEGPALMDPILDAVARGQVAMFTPFDSELFGSKAPLAMISEQRNRHLFSPAELEAIDRVLPWTRMVRPGPVTLEDGSTVDLFDYATSHAADLVLKPTLLHGGVGVLPGWHPDTTEQVWRDELGKAMGGPYVLQRRVVPDPELCPGENGELIPWIVTWGVFTFPTGYGGGWARAFPVSSGREVTRAGTGLLYGSTLVAGWGTGR